MTSQEAAVKALAEARAALDRLGKRALDPESTAKNVTPELVEETREFNALAIFLAEDIKTLEDAIRMLVRIQIRMEREDNVGLRWTMTWIPVLKDCPPKSQSDRGAKP